MNVPREEWIGVPVPDPGIPKELVLAARNSIKDNVRVSNCGRRFWELTGGVLRCAACGYAMGTNFITPRATGYYRCSGRYRSGVRVCSETKVFRAEETEAFVWRFVSGVLKDPVRLERGLNEMLEREKTLASRGPDDEEEAWLKRLAELKTQEDRLLDLYLEGKVDVDRYEARAAQIKQARKTVEDELARSKSRAIHIELLERDKDALLNHYAQVVPESLQRKS